MEDANDTIFRVFGYIGMGKRTWMQRLKYYWRLSYYMIIQDNIRWRRP